ncbi:DUF1822 family protein [cf. Phormidesmis sp. LEGE 11477]|uniref:DUF1822 family protein n=1 Tax=cf. Phormidesmis sp. LEGE 11477 TaxID=1828680 RepID=UPI0018810BA8|nr:DUF1822 family protein [cf. Phormidesmis sp. LEGE 11477]MBE9063762.1 DUF1822 family protein [cf. Phormidesmis sp. LEGE 11477]
MSLVLENPLQPILEIPLDLALWERGGVDIDQAAAVDQAAQWRIYLHRLGASAILQWCQDALADAQSFSPSEAVQDKSTGSAQLWPNTDPVQIWHVVDGIAIDLGERRIVVTISEAIDAAEMRVPQEWIDLPDWAGDYYIAAYADVDEQALALWGYTTYAKVKQQGRYDAGDRTYCIEEDSLIQDFSAFWAAQQLEVLAPVNIEVLPEVSPTQLDNLIQRLASSPGPRLEIPFELWGALLSNPDARSRLYQQRWRKKTTQISLANAPIQLGQWTAQFLSPGWNSLARLLSQPPTPSLRSGPTNNNPTTETSATTTGAKEISLETATETVLLVLAISVTSEVDERRNIRIRLYPKDAAALNTQTSQDFSPYFLTDEPILEEILLPEGVTLTLLLTETQQPLQTVCSGSHDNYIQLPPFRCPTDEAFSIRIEYANSAMQEDFVG